MRAAFGLVGILLTLGVIVWFLGPGGGLAHEKAAIDAGNKAHDTMSQVAGRDAETGTPVKESATLQISTSGGKTDSVLVTSIQADGAYAKFWGLQRKDSIIELGSLNVRDQVTSKDDADAYLMDAYQKQQPIIVVRDGKKITLPQSNGTPPKSPQSSLQSQLDAIQKGGSR